MSSSDLEAYLGRDTRAADTMRAGPRLAAVQPPTCHLGISEASLKRLWTANVVRDQYTNTTLPEDLKPLLVLDASGRVRRAYQSWANGNRKDIVSITASSKNYANLTIHHWQRGGGKWSIKNDAQLIAKG
jgi:hypothetical protein